MNKKEFINELAKKLNLKEESANIINDIFEDNFLIGRKNKEKIISSLKEKLNIDNTRAGEIYNSAMEIITRELKKQIIHPFKDQDPKENGK